MRIDTLFIHAVNVHQGGGAQLLKVLLSAIKPHYRTVLSVDSRMHLPDNLPSCVEIRQVGNSVFARLLAEIWLYRNATNGDSVLCFGNLPPLFPLRAFTSVFIQNRFLVENVLLTDFKIWPRIRISIERIWLRLCIFHANKYLVQSSSMQLLMQNLVKDLVPVSISPFTGLDCIYLKNDIPFTCLELPRFVYIASGDAHKNHRCLVEAWCILALEGIRPTLTLTVDQSDFSDLCNFIAEKIFKYDLKINNLGTVDSNKVNQLYQLSEALIYPSLLESFGLPLIEATVMGLDIIASELDFVRDVARPVQCFDPSSALSIARAVKRYCRLYDPGQQLLTADQFLRSIVLRHN